LISSIELKKELFMENLMSYTDAAHFLGLKKGTLYTLVCRHQIPHIRLGGGTSRKVKFDPAELRALVESSRVPALEECNSSGEKE
jgi:excisionase family DNA binding protein